MERTATELRALTNAVTEELTEAMWQMVQAERASTGEQQEDNLRWALHALRQAATHLAGTLSA
jgi:hypothetical protein